MEAGIGLDQLLKHEMEEEDSFLDDSMSSHPKTAMEMNESPENSAVLSDDKISEPHDTLPDVGSMPSDPRSTLATVRTTLPTLPEHTVIQVDLDLDNPEVSDDSKEAEQRFQEAMKASLSTVQNNSYSSSVFDAVHAEIMEQKEDLSASVIEKINATIESFQPSFDETMIESEESPKEAAPNRQESERLSLTPLNIEIEKRNRIDCQSISSEEKKQRTE